VAACSKETVLSSAAPGIEVDPMPVQALGKGGDPDWLTPLQLGELVAFVMEEPALKYLDSLYGCGLRWVWDR
jgi:hypothetical protein